MAEEERKTEIICVRIEEKWAKMLYRIKQEYGIDISATVRMSIYFFLPRFLEALKALEARALIELAEYLDQTIYERLREHLYEKLRQQN